MKESSLAKVGSAGRADSAASATSAGNAALASSCEVFAYLDGVTLRLDH